MREFLEKIKSQLIGKKLKSKLELREAILELVNLNSNVTRKFEL